MTKSSNFNVKGYLLNSNSNFFRLVKALREMCSDHKRRMAQMIAEQEKRVRQIYLSQHYLGQLPRQVSYYALDQIAKEHRVALKAIPSYTCAAEDIGQCTSDCTVKDQKRLPCCHLILARLKQKSLLKLADVDPHWHLEQQLVSSFIAVDNFILLIFGCLAGQQPIPPDPKPPHCKSCPGQTPKQPKATARRDGSTTSRQSRRARSSAKRLDCITKFAATATAAAYEA